jgi:multidrug resistance efflux pump
MIRPARLRRVASVLLVAAIAAAGGVWYASSPATSAIAATTPARADGRLLIAPGLVEPERDPVALAFESPGRVVAIAVDDGDPVTAGQVVAQLDDRFAKARLAGAEAALAAAKARLDLARTGALPEEIAAARAEVAAARAAAAERSTARGRAERLASTGALPAAQADADIASSQVAAAQVDAAAARLRLLERGTRSELRRAAEAEVAAAEAQVAAAQVDLDNTSLRSPVSGIALRRLAEVGTLVATMTPTPIVSVADVGTLQLRVEVDEVDIAGLAVGQTGWATARAHGERRFTGRVTRIHRELGRKEVRTDDPRARVDTRVLEVIFSFDADAGAEVLPLGLRLELHLPVTAPASAAL